MIVRVSTTQHKHQPKLLMRSLYVFAQRAQDNIEELSFWQEDKCE